MSVRAKFRLNSFTTELHSQYPHQTENGQPDYSKPESVEKRTLNFTPVSGGEGEDKLFWDASPSGSLQLGVVNQDAWEHFALGKSYYLDFTLAD
jgi:hypothetical protein